MMWKSFNVLRKYSTIKPFDHIPGPKPLPFFGNSLLFSPLGPYNTTKMLEGFADLQKQHGDILKLKMGGQFSVLLFNPDDIRTMFEHEGKFPQRPTFEALKQYRKKKFNSVGIVPDNGEEWYRLRQNISTLLKLKTVHSYWHRQKAIAQIFAENLTSKVNQEGILEDFIQYAFLYSLEAIGAVCYGKQLNCITSTSEECRAIIKANINFLKSLGRTFHQAPWWKLWKTKAYKEIECTQDFMMKIAIKYLNEARMRLANNSNKFFDEDPVLYQILENQNLSEVEKNLLVTEIFQGGIDATATVLTLMLYELARNPSIQDAIYDDLSKQEMKPGQSPSLLRASLKEVLRLYPTAGATSRILASNSTFSGYFIPKGTLAIGVNPIISRMDRYFRSPSKFDPWRWLGKTEVVHPYSSLPFGHGARMCPGRRFAEQEILLGVAEVILRFKVVSITPKDISMVLSMNLVPSEPVCLKLIERRNTSNTYVAF